MFELDPFIESIRHLLDRHALEQTGAYRRFFPNHEREGSGLNPYGCADALNLYCTIGQTPPTETWPEWVKTIQSLQNPETGLFEEKTHHPIHVTAHCIAALNLLGAKAKTPLYEIYEQKEQPIGERMGFAEIDWVYCLTRARSQCGHRWQGVQTALEEMCGIYVPMLLSRDPETDNHLNDLHVLFGAVCALAELQRALPGRLRSTKPLQLVLDRRPFI
jgi:hypothetical protein